MPPSPRPPSSGPPSQPGPSPSPSTGLRRAVERASLPLLVRMSRLPRPVPFLVLLALLVVGIYVAGPVAVLCTGLVALVVGWLMYLGWPRLTSTERLGRVAVLLVAVALCVVQIFPRG